MGHHQGGTLYLLHHIGDGKGLARPGHPQQRLMGKPILQPFHQLCNGGGLIPRRLVFGMDFEFTH